MFSTILKFNHNHSARGHVSPRTGRPDGGKFTTQYEQEVDARTGKPKYDKNGKAIHVRDKDGNKIPKPLGYLRQSAGYDQGAANQQRGQRRGGDAPLMGAAITGSARDPNYAVQMEGVIDNTLDKLTGGMVVVQHRVSKTNTSGLKNAPATADVFAINGEQLNKRNVDLQVSTKECCSEQRMAAIIVAQKAGGTPISAFEANQNFLPEGVRATSSNVERFGTVKYQPDHHDMAIIHGGSFASEKEVLDAFKATIPKNNTTKYDLAVSRTPDGNWAMHYKCPNFNTAKGVKVLPGGRGAHDRFVKFAEKQGLVSDVKNWSGVDAKLDNRTQVREAKKFVESTPEHPLSKEWEAMQRAMNVGN